MGLFAGFVVLAFLIAFLILGAVFMVWSFLLNLLTSGQYSKTDDKKQNT